MAFNPDIQGYVNHSWSQGQSQSKAPQIGFSFKESFLQKEIESALTDSYIPVVCHRPEKNNKTLTAEETVNSYQACTAKRKAELYYS